MGQSHQGSRSRNRRGLDGVKGAQHKGKGASSLGPGFWRSLHHEITPTPLQVARKAELERPP